MSGPKVVRVRTREELAAECNVLIDALLAASEDCEAFTLRHDLVDSDSIQRRKLLIEDLHRKVAAGEFDTVRRTCQIEIAAVGSEREHVEDEVLRRAADVATRRRRYQYLAASLAKKLQMAGKAVPTQIEDAGRGQIGQSDEALKAVEVIVSRALAEQALADAQANDRTMTDEQRRLADFLTESGPETAPPVATNSAFKRLERAMTEVSTLDASSVGAQMLARMQVVVDEPDAPQAPILIDSLLFEWSERRKTLREIAHKQVRAKQLALELARLSDSQARELSAHLVEATEQDLDMAIARAQSHIDKATREIAAIDRRKAVLKGLAALGYEIGSELSTAWTRKGRVVVAKPDRPGYGVELSGPPDANQMQVKVVAFSSRGLERDAARDRDAETLWCSDFGRLQKLLSQAGTSVNVVRALGAGAIPVTQVEGSTADERDELGLDRPQSRSLT